MHNMGHYETNDWFVPLVMRIRMLRQYKTDGEIAHMLVGEGQSPARVWLCLKAAEILDK